MNVGYKKILKNHKCSTCGNLSYYDGYFCKLGKHHTKKEILSMRPLKNCEFYKKRQGSNWKECKDQEECIFWCSECPVYRKIEREKYES